ncbi:hypothetical protein R6Q59_035733 [Mikania micrantha]
MQLDRRWCVCRQTRLVVLYKYGVYLDTDFTALKDSSGLRNLIGAQSATRFGNWTRLNNVVFEFALNFDGNRWGHNEPYLVLGVVERGKVSNLSVLPPEAFFWWTGL